MIGKLIFYTVVLPRNLSSKHLQGRLRERAGQSYFLPRTSFGPKGAAALVYVNVCMESNTKKVDTRTSMNVGVCVV